MAADPPDEPITREQLAESFREARGEVEGRAKDGAPKLIPVAVGVGLAVLVLVFLVGKRVGKTKSTVVEIRRI